MFRNKKNNFIYIHKVNGTTKCVKSIHGLSINFKGKNSVINIYEPCHFKFQLGAKRSHILINGDNNIINIRPNIYLIKSFRIKYIGNNNTINIGKNLRMTDGVNIDFAFTNNLKLNIGDDCLFGQNIKFMLGDHHNIYSLNDNNKLNSAKDGIYIGNNVWLARNVSILKDSKINDNSVVAYGSIVTKKFEQKNIIIGGIPATVIKDGITWSY